MVAFGFHHISGNVRQTDNTFNAVCWRRWWWWWW